MQTYTYGREKVAPSAPGRLGIQNNFMDGLNATKGMYMRQAGITAGAGTSLFLAYNRVCGAYVWRVRVVAAS